MRFDKFIRFILSTLDHAGVLFVIARVALVHDLVCYHEAIIGTGALSLFKLFGSMLEKLEVEKKIPCVTIEERNFALLQLKLLVHVNMRVEACDKVAEHLIAGHF